MVEVNFAQCVSTIINEKNNRDRVFYLFQVFGLNVERARDASL